MAMTKVKNLQMWCKRMAEGYREVEVRDMAASWKSGLVFCAIIHRFRPDLIDYDSLSKENVFDNNQLAFEVAERELGIAAFLEAADMVAIRVPDRLSVVTYVSQYYNYFHDKPQLGGPDVREAQTPPSIKTTAAVKSDVKKLTPAQQNARNTPKTRQETIGDKCTMCHEKVYLLERHIENGKLFHRSCFRRSDLSPQSKVFKRHPFDSNDEDKKETVQNKFRKIGTDQDSSSKNGSSEGELDFWQRRAQAKVKDSSSQDNVTSKSAVSVDKDSKTNSNTSVQNAGTPAWKRSKDVEMIEENRNKFPPKLSPVPQKKGFQVDDKETKSSSAAGKPNNLLANKFKELEERTLKNSGNSKEKNADKNITQNVKLDKKTAAEKNKSESKSNICPPVAKPRQIKKQIENMDTSEEQSTAFQPKPSPRVQRSQDNTRAISSPRTVSPTPTCKSPVQYQSDFSRPKTPPQKQTTGLSMHNDTTKKDVSEIKKSDRSAPPLPVRSPPSVPKTQPHKVDISLPKSPHASPRFEPKKTKHEVKVPSVAEFSPSKPPRVSSNDVNSERSGSPMEAVTTTVPSKAVVHEPKVEPAAMFVVPDKNKHGETKNREIFGGLLKSLADVRTKYDVDAKPGNTNSHHGATSKVTSGDKNLANMSAERSGQKVETVKVVTKIETKTKEVSKKEEISSNRFNKPARPKSSFISGRYDVTETKKETSVVADRDNLPTKPIADKSKLTTPETTTTSHKVELRTKEESDIPLWKQQLDKRKAERERPKSADILGDKTNNENKPAWQKEAEQRIMARNGKYVDPEKAKIDSDVSKNTPTKEVTENKNANSLITPVPVKPEFPIQRKVPAIKPPDAVDEYIPTVEKNKGKDDRNVSPANVRRRILPTAPKEAEKEKIPPLQPAGDRKKIGVDHKFVFEEIETTITPKKPPRPPHPPSPKSPGAPSRPPRPKKESPGKKPVLTAYQIQKQLQLIDTRLTQLELKGRTLEDSIRNAEAEEEDDLMIGWFTLVNEKNELVRKEADVIYLSREQELEDEQQTIDDQLQRLLHKPDHLKSEEERQEEAYLIDKKLDVVNQRSYIVDSIDEDRLRYEEEDRDIEAMIKKKGFLKDDKEGNVVKKNKKKSKPPS